MLHRLTELFKTKEDEVFAWLESQLNGIELPVYTSCDVRNSGVKLVPVDTNIFPAGWNNLCPSYRRKASTLFKDFFVTRLSSIKCILLVTEEHTRNSFYFSNVKALSEILSEAGFEVTIGNPNSEITGPTILTTSENETITVYPLERKEDVIYANGKKMCCILYNNDFSGGIPEILKNIKQPSFPDPVKYGWHTRLKSEHFEQYNKLACEFAKIIGFDPWHIRAEYAELKLNVNLNEDTDREKLAVATNELVMKIKQQYTERGIDHEPTVFIKNNSGTYGIGVISVKNGDEVRNLNRKDKNKLSVGKGNVEITNFILQEGVPTFDTIKGMSAEPVIYLVGGEVSGGFFRVNEGKGKTDNLNSPGMKFVKMCFDKVLGYENTKIGECDLDCLDRLYKVVSQLAVIAAGKENS